MKLAMEEMDRRREVQRAFNAEHGITPASIVKSVDEIRFTTRVADAREDPVPRAEALSAVARAGAEWADMNAEERQQVLDELDAEMRRAADDLDFELAAQLRDQIMDLKANGGGRGSRAGGRDDGAPTKRRRRARR